MKRLFQLGGSIFAGQNFKGNRRVLLRAFRRGVGTECRARGLFRKNGVSPLVGDWVEIEETGEEKGYVTRILDRKNSLILSCRWRIWISCF